MTKAVVMSLALFAVTATSCAAERGEVAADNSAQTYTYVVGMSGIT